MKRTKPVLITVLLTVVTSILTISGLFKPLSANSSPERRLVQNESLEEFKQRRRRNMRDQSQQFLEYVENRSKEYVKFYKKRKKQFEKFKNRIARHWGKDNVDVSTKKTMSNYSDDFTERNIVDFEDGTARAEVLVSKEEVQNNPKKVQEKLKDEVKDMVTDKTIEDPLDRMEDTKARGKDSDEETGKKSKGDGTKDQQVTMDEPILSGQVKTQDGEIVTEKNADEYSEEVVQPDETQSETVTGEDGKQRVKVSVEVELVSKHTRKRARKYLGEIKQQAERFNIQPALILAVMHSESSFNPKARSHIPAYGLMQLVPSTGGKAAYKHLYGEERVLKPDYLYDPENNIELGVGYLDLLLHQYLDDVDNSTSRWYCGVSAYNTGPGNLAKTFVDEMVVSDAVEEINTMSPQQVYTTLRQDLPYDETKKYIKRIKKRRKQYQKWLNTRSG